jgi:large subunit ribosomal protein L18
MNKLQSRKKRIRRTRAKISGSAVRPRLCVFRSLRSVYAQIVDDKNGKILVSVDSRKMPAPKGRGLASGGEKAKNNIETAGKIGEEIAKLAVAKKIGEVVFDKRGYKYHGKVRALAEGARKGGLKF